jgi:hypothetical protein
MPPRPSRSVPTPPLEEVVAWATVTVGIVLAARHFSMIPDVAWWWLRWIAGGVLFAVGAHVIVMNDAVLVYVLRRRPAPSAIPFVGGALAAVALAIIPLAGARAWWWLPIVLDWGCVVVVVSVTSLLVRATVRRVTPGGKD